MKSAPRLILTALLTLALALPAALPAASERSALGTPLPALDLQFPRGGKPQVSGKAVLVEFWATWCPPCRTSIPHLNTLYKKFKADGFVIVGVTDEDKSAVDTFLAKTPMDYTLALDKDGRFTEPFKVTGIPHAVLYDRTGKAIWEGHPMSLDDSLVSQAMARTSAASDKLDSSPVRASGADQLYHTITTAQLRKFLDAEKVAYTLDKDGDIVATFHDARGLFLSEKDYVQFRIAIRAKATLDFANRWNSDKRYSKCYLDKDGDPVLELELDLAGGIHHNRIVDFVKTCDLAVGTWLKELKEL